MARYDYIIAGAGASGLSLLMRMIQSTKFEGKSILLVDREGKNANDRTWCFWEKEEGFFEPIVCCRWHQLWFHARSEATLHDISPYTYKLIRGGDFYQYCLTEIGKHSNITFHQGEVQQCFSDDNATGIILDGEKIYSDYVFNSILFRDSLLAGNHHYLLQHFKGWLIQTPGPSFTPDKAILMDFRTNQKNGTTFVYVMPYSETKALVEYTLFSSNVLDDSLYDEGLSRYCTDVLKLHKYDIIEKEFGVIPMTNYVFQKAHHAIINIGTVGGQTKGSTGYTFQFVQKHTEEIVNALINTGKPFLDESKASSRFDFYDAVLLNILANNTVGGEEIFTKLMKKNDLKLVLKFLENKTNIAEEVYLIRNLPKRIFWRAAKEEMFKPTSKK